MWIRNRHGELVNLAHARVVKLGYFDYANDPEGMEVRAVWGLDLSIDEEGNLDYDVIYEGTREECEAVLRERIAPLLPVTVNFYETKGG